MDYSSPKRASSPLLVAGSQRQSKRLFLEVHPFQGAQAYLVDRVKLRPLEEACLEVKAPHQHREVACSEDRAPLQLKEEACLGDKALHLLREEAYSGVNNLKQEGFLVRIIPIRIRRRAYLVANNRNSNKPLYWEANSSSSNNSLALDLLVGHSNLAALVVVNKVLTKMEPLSGSHLLSSRP